MIERDYDDPALHPAIVLAADGWHPGVVGIVASRVVERFGRPTFLIGLDGDVGARERPQHRWLRPPRARWSTCGDLLERFGGHRMAAGLSIRRDRVDAFRERFNAAALAQLTPADLGPTQRVDLELGLDEVTDELERWSRELEPCGMGNPGAGIRRPQRAAERVRAWWAPITSRACSSAGAARRRHDRVRLGRPMSPSTATAPSMSRSAWNAMNGTGARRCRRARWRSAPAARVTRIVSGMWGGRRLVVPPDRRVRPTAERVREAWLNILDAGAAGRPHPRSLRRQRRAGTRGVVARRGACDVRRERTPIRWPRCERTSRRSAPSANTEMQRADAVRFVAGLGAGAL